MKRCVISTCLLLILFFNISIVQAVVVSGIIAIVNDDIITTYDLEKEFVVVARETGRKEPFSEADRLKMRSTLTQRLVDKVLVDHKIKELGIKIPEEEIRQSIEEVKKQNKISQERLVEALAAQGVSFDQYKTQIKEQLERLRLMSMEVRAKVQVPVKEMTAYYESNRERYGAQELYKARHILFKIPKDAKEADLEKVRAKADDVLKEIKKGADFIEAAKKYSDDPNAAKDGGELGTFKKGDLVPEMETVVFKLKQGEVSEPIKTATSFHIIKLESKALGNAKPFEEVKTEIEDMLYKQKSEERFSQWVAELRKNASIEIR